MQSPCTRTSTYSLMCMAFDMAIDQSITAYDASYVALAHQGYKSKAGQFSVGHVL